MTSRFRSRLARSTSTAPRQSCDYRARLYDRVRLPREVEGFPATEGAIVQVFPQQHVVFDYNGSLEQFLDWLSAPRPSVDVAVAFWNGRPRSCGAALTAWAGAEA
jgi:hypothetical protein